MQEALKKQEEYKKYLENDLFNVFVDEFDILLDSEATLLYKGIFPHLKNVYSISSFIDLVEWQLKILTDSLSDDVTYYALSCSAPTIWKDYVKMSPKWFDFCDKSDKDKNLLDRVLLPTKRYDHVFVSNYKLDKDTLYVDVNIFDKLNIDNSSVCITLELKNAGQVKLNKQLYKINIGNHDDLVMLSLDSDDHSAWAYGSSIKVVSVLLYNL